MKRLVSPLARRFASQKGIDLEEVSGSGKLGRVSFLDVKKLWESSQQGSLRNSFKNSFETAINSTGEEFRQITPTRAAIAKALKNSWEQVAYVSLLLEANVTKLFLLRKRVLEEVLNKTGVKLTFLSFILRAFALALAEQRVFGAKLSEDKKSLVLPSSIDIGVAVDTEFGLMVPVVRRADSKTITSLQQEIVELATKCRQRRITPAELKGGVFTVTNYGSVGAITGTPVINYPEIAIGGVGAVQERVVVTKEGGFEAAKILPITLAADHRWVDGADIGRFGKRVVHYLENPELLGVL